MFWKQPHKIKVYEALSAIADNRLELISEAEAKCISTSRGKAYEITYDQTTGAMMSNDNSAFYTDTLSYPMIAFLLLEKHIDFDKSILPYLANIMWKDINQKFKNDYVKAIGYVLTNLSSKGYPIDKIKTEIGRIYEIVCELKVEQYGSKKKPSSVY